MKSQPHAPGLDEIDLSLLSELSKNAELTNKELARRVGIAESTCAYRVRQLRASNVIESIHAQLNLAALGYPVQAVISVRLGSHNQQLVNEFFDSVSAVQGVLQVFNVAGSSDFLVHVAVQDTQALRDIVLEHITAHRAVRQAETHIAFDVRPGVGVLP
ncbi:MAG: Lrp/AsnC family transcriptional regulator [Microbacteriaceae bacterium]